MGIDDYTKRFIIHRLKWLGLYMGISLILLYLLPFPYDYTGSSNSGKLSQNEEEYHKEIWWHG